ANCNDFTQAYPDDYDPSTPPENPKQTGASSINRFYSDVCFGDSTYHLSFDVPHASASLSLTVSGSNLQGWDDEGWGIDNVAVSVNGAVAGPNLSTTLTGSLPAFVDAGDKFPMVDTTTNNGSDAAGLSVTRFYWSTDGVVDALDRKAGGRKIASLAPGASAG